PKNSPSAPAELIVFVAKRPVAIAPQVPPIPWTPNASSESSYPRAFLIVLVAKKQMTPPPTPMMIEETGPTNPEAGVIATSPATAPLAAPNTVGLPRTAHSAIIQPNAAAAAAVFVTTKALTAR